MKLPLPRVAACAFLILHLVPAQAQDFSATPTYGSVSLSSGFSPDPYVVQVSAGGALEAANVSSDCVGFVANAPDFRLEYDQDRYVLSIFAVADSDTTLLVNDPGGNWHCSDDSSDLDNANPGIVFSTPRSGRYDIWVGSYSADDNYASARLVISEQGTENWRNIVAGLGRVTNTPIDPPDPAPVTVTDPEQGQDQEPVPPPPPQPTEGVIQYGRKTN